jgi:predicted phosphate transport protein (TIGR00153 family)
MPEATVVSFLPKEEKFFNLFQRICAVNVEGARTLERLVREPGAQTLHVRRLRELEHEADAITHDTLDRLNRTFLTPFDREDIDALARILDEVMDHIEEAGQRIGIYRIDAAREDASELSSTAVKAAEEIEKVFAALHDHKRNKAKIRAHLIEINRIENESDAQFRTALSHLFEEGDLSPIEVLKWKDVCELIETSVDMCERIAHVVDGILVKHA